MRYALAIQGGYLLAAFIVCATLVAQDSASTPKRTPLIAEEGVRYSLKDGVLEIRGGGGWVRFRQPVADFDVEFEFQALEPETDAGLMVRTWTGRGEWPQRGYRLNLPLSASMPAQALFIGRKASVTVAQQGKVDLRPSGEWQRVQLTAEGQKIRVMLNGSLAGEFAIDETVGYLLFENRKGRVQFRNVVVRQRELTAAIPDHLLRFKQVLDAGGQAPEVLREVKPRYTSDAMRRRAEGVVTLEAVVGADGLIHAVRIVRFLDPELDLAAVVALRRWKFKPALIQGNPVPVVVEVELKFTLK